VSKKVVGKWYEVVGLVAGLNNFMPTVDIQ